MRCSSGSRTESAARAPREPRGVTFRRSSAQSATRPPSAPSSLAYRRRAETGRGESRARRELCKGDLVTAWSGEFPELQGVMGKYYAGAGGEHGEVATATGEHYRPRSAGNAIPSTDAGLAVSLADKLDTLAGIFAIGQKPRRARIHSGCAAPRSACCAARREADGSRPAQLIKTGARTLQPGRSATTSLNEV